MLNLQEQVYVLYLNNKNEVICWRCINTGTCDTTLFDLKLALACGLNCMASKIILAHNHPSGLLKASAGDISVTKQLKKAAMLIDIQLVDHVIISRDGYFSFLDHRLLKCSQFFVAGLFLLNNFIKPFEVLNI
jgi:DNA repair protein RadC